MKKKFNYNEETGVSTCTLYHKKGTIVKTANLHPEDADMKSERTGLGIAEMRADIEYLKYLKRNQLEPQLEILNHLYNCMSQSTYFNSKSYEAKMLRRQIYTIQNQLDGISQDLADEEQYLKDYLKTKDKLYNRIRARQGQN